MSIGKVLDASSSISVSDSFSNTLRNKTLLEDKPFHDWYRFVLSFPPHLVREYISKFDLNEKSLLLDPFCGTGTTLVEAKLNGVQSIGIERNPVAHFASETKVSWDVEPKELYAHAVLVADYARQLLEKDGIDDDGLSWESKAIELKRLSKTADKLLLKKSISPLPLHKALTLLESIRDNKDIRFAKYEELALAKALYSTIGNLRFGPEVGLGKIKEDATVISSWLALLANMVNDLKSRTNSDAPGASVYLGDSRDLGSVLKDQRIDAVITSPPYPNEKDYTRTTRLESVVLGYVNSLKDLRELKKGLVRSNTRGVYKQDVDDDWIQKFPKIQELSDSIERRREQLEKTSGFEKLYSKVVKLYFGGMARHLESLQPFLNRDARLAYVVGDQASYFQVPIRTGRLLSEIARSLGYDVEELRLFRTRFSTITKEQMKEEVLTLRWRG